MPLFRCCDSSVCLSTALSLRSIAPARPPKVLAAAILSLLPAITLAQQADGAAPTLTQDLDPVLVEAERLRIRTEQSRARLDARAGGTALVEAEDFRSGRASTLTDMLAFTPGVYSQNRHGEEVRFSIRGSGIQRGFLMRGVQLMQDGIPLSTADGSGDYQALDPLALEMIEVWRGANALEYGAATLGGAVNFVTPVGSGAAPAAARIDAGWYGQRRGHVAFGGAGTGVDGHLALTYGEQDGWREQSGYRATRLSGNVGMQWTPDLEARIYMQSVDSMLQMPGSLSRQAIAQNPRQAVTGYAQQNSSNNYILNRLAARVTWIPQIGREVSSAVWFTDRDRYHPMIWGILDQQSIDTGFDLRTTLDFGDGATRRLIAGVSAGRHRGEQARFNNNGGRPGMATGFDVFDARRQALYAEYSHGVGQALILQAGAQAVRAQRTLDNRTSPLDSYDAIFDGFNPKLGMLYALADGSQLYANVSRSFEVAPFGETAVRAQLPPPNAQKATTFELGWRRRSANVEWEATAYRALIDGELLALTDANGIPLGTANAERTIHQGVELGASLPIGDALRLRGNYLWNDFLFDDERNFGDNRIAGIAPHQLRAELEWKIAPQLAVAPMIEWQPVATWIDHANTVSQSVYTLFHLRAHGELSAQWRWFAELRNLTDRNYVATTLAVANAFGRDGGYYFPGDPRSAYVGLEWKFR